MKTKTRLTIASLLFGCAATITSAQTIVPNLADLPSMKGWKSVNRSAALITERDKTAVRLNGENGTGYAKLEKFSFSDGEIEVDLRGKDIPQQSFLGMAFHGTDTDRYDAVYFRPFNFTAKDAARQSRAVQYISHPSHTWKKLRTEHPGRYESKITPVPDPDGWFHVRVVVAWPDVTVFVNGAEKPCLSVKQLSNQKSGWLALWTDVKGGDFANLKITPAPGEK